MWRIKTGRGRREKMRRERERNKERRENKRNLLVESAHDWPRLTV